MFSRRRKKREQKLARQRTTSMLFKTIFVDTIPIDSSEIAEGTLYVSMKFDTVVHRCPCGCDSLVEVTLHPATRSLTYDGQYLSIDPSIGVKLPCRSHYSIIKNQVVWWDDSTHMGSLWYDYDRKSKMRHYKDRANLKVRTRDRRRLRRD